MWEPILTKHDRHALLELKPWDSRSNKKFRKLIYHYKNWVHDREFALTLYHSQNFWGEVEVTPNEVGWPR